MDAVALVPEERRSRNSQSASCSRAGRESEDREKGRVTGVGIAGDAI
jgi:hypothetical protein